VIGRGGQAGAAGDLQRWRRDQESGNGGENRSDGFTTQPDQLHPADGAIVIAVGLRSSHGTGRLKLSKFRGQVPPSPRSRRDEAKLFMFGSGVPRRKENGDIGEAMYKGRPPPGGRRVGRERETASTDPGRALWILRPGEGPDGPGAARAGRYQRIFGQLAHGRVVGELRVLAPQRPTLTAGRPVVGGGPERTVCRVNPAVIGSC